MSEVVDNHDQNRFELRKDGEVATAAYELAGSTITFTHTVVPSSLEGQGVGTRLVAAALDAARDRGLRVVPQCSFVAAFIRKHPDYADLLA